MQLKNHDLTITLNEKGAIQKIVDRKLNRSYLEVEQFLNLFRLCVPSPNGMAVMQIPIPARRTLPRKRMETFWGHSKILLQPTEKA